jgi:hypothetical protein
MRRFAACLTVPCMSAALLFGAAAWAADSGGNAGSTSTTDQAGKSAKTSNADSGNGAAGRPSSTAGSTTPDTINLTEAQRSTIRSDLATEKSNEMFNEPTTKGLKDFKPAIGEAVPAQLHLQAMPTTLVQKVPAVGNYAYMKVKDQVLIINPMTKKIVDMFSQTPG